MVWGFYFDLLHGLIAIYPYFLIFVSVASFCLGVDFYMNAMVEDLAATLNQINQIKTKGDFWSTYVNEIRFHIEIYEYGLFFEFAP